MEPSLSDEQIGRLKERMLPVIKDIERRLVALEIRPTESALSSVIITDEQNPLPMTTLIERIQVLELKVNNLEPSLSTLHSSISSTPLDSQKAQRKKMDRLMIQLRLLLQFKISHCRDEKKIQKHGLNPILEKSQTMLWDSP